MAKDEDPSLTLRVGIGSTIGLTPDARRAQLRRQVALDPQFAELLGVDR
jgi:hypothetical protein